MNRRDEARRKLAETLEEWKDAGVPVRDVVSAIEELIYEIADVDED